jgi:hypothetical protein
MDSKSTFKQGPDKREAFRFSFAFLKPKQMPEGTP